MMLQYTDRGEDHVHPDSFILPGHTGYSRNSNIAHLHSYRHVELSRHSPTEFSLAPAQLASDATIGHCLPLLPGNDCQLWHLRRSLDMALPDRCLQNW